jgi:hypothetical protein
MELLVPIFLFLCIAGVLILRPISKKLGLLIEALAKERLADSGAGSGSRAGRAGLDAAQIDRVTTALEQLNTRLDLVDDRMAFMERLMESRPTQRLTG